MAAEDVKIVGRLYNLGNDYPADVGCRPFFGDWKANSYLDGIYTEAEEGWGDTRYGLVDKLTKYR